MKKIMQTQTLNRIMSPSWPNIFFLTGHMGWRKRLKLFGERGEEAVDNKLQQIHDMEGFQPKHWYELTKEERTKALKNLIYLEEKRDGRIKGRGCADGKPRQ